MSSLVARTILRGTLRWTAPIRNPLRSLSGPRSSILSRPFLTSSPFLKKSKAAAVKRSHQQAKDADPELDSHRYQKAPEAELETVLERTKSKMAKSVDWAKGVVYEGVERGRGRISPGKRADVPVDIAAERLDSIVGYGKGYGPRNARVEISEFGGFGDGEGELAACRCLGARCTWQRFPRNGLFGTGRP